MEKLPHTIVIVGPTAGGKTELSMALAQKLAMGGEIVCADSMQVYRGMDIGTAKPTAAQRAAVPHHLLDLIEPTDDGFSVDAWLRLARQCIVEIAQRGRMPIVVGGTNLYIQALLHGMLEGPEPNAPLRQKLEATDQDALRRRLEEVDPEAAARIHSNDRKRTIRAVEVFELTGQRLSDLQRQWNEPRTGDDVFMVGLDYPVAVINQRINARVKAMFEQGFVEEVRRLTTGSPGGNSGGSSGGSFGGSSGGSSGGGALGRQASEALGYAQMLEQISGRLSEEEAFEQIKIQTRRYARKQRTWLKRFRTHQPGLWIDACGRSTEDIVNEALTPISQWLGPFGGGNSRCGRGG